MKHTVVIERLRGNLWEPSNEIIAYDYTSALEIKSSIQVHAAYGYKVTIRSEGDNVIDLKERREG